MGTRSAVALREGLDETLVAAVADYEASDLSEKRKVALRLADAYLIGMGRVPPALRAQVAEHLTPAEVLDIGLLLCKSIQNKIRIALRTDADEVRIHVV